MEYFFQSNKSIYNLSDEAIALLEANMEVLKVAKGETFLSQGDKNHYLYFVSTGLVRCWFTKEIKEHSLNFAFEGELAIFPIDGNMSSPINAVAIENTTLLRINQNRLEALFTEHNELAIWGYKTVKTMISIFHNEYLNIFWMNKKDAYLKLVEKHPDVLQRIPLKDVASYLNITTSSLSKIRAEVKL